MAVAVDINKFRTRLQHGDEVIALIHHHEQEIEIFSGKYLDCVQMSAYTTPFYVFLTFENTIRMVNSNAVREFRFGPFEKDYPQGDDVPWENDIDEEYYGDDPDYEDEIDF